jgi:hypothetical protein
MTGCEQKRDSPGKEIQGKKTAGKGVGKEHEKDGNYFGFSSLR